MILAPALTLLFAVGPVGTPSSEGRQVDRTVELDEVDDRIRAAGGDVGALLELAASFAEAGAPADAKRVYERVIELDADNETARAGLRHQRYDGRWFESYVALARYKREEAARMKERGLVRFLEEWIPEADLPFRRMGWVKDETGAWADPFEIERERQEAEWAAAGYLFRADDSTWVAPDEVDNWSALLWKCGDEWLDQEAADAFHGDPSRPWVLTGEHFVVMTTCPWGYGDAARWHAEQVHPHLARLFGVEPARRPTLLVLNSLDQYNAEAGGSLIDSDGFSSLHGAYFCDAARDTSQGQERWVGMGVSYWQSDGQGVGSWGPYWVRWAAAQSYVDSIDRSWQAVGALLGPDDDIDLATFGEEFWAEKRVPRWLRYGAASYVERYRPNPGSAEDDDPWSTRKFAFDELRKAGGLRDLEAALAFELTLDDVPGSTHMLYEVGLVVSYLLDGAPDDAELRGRLTDLQQALATGDRQAADEASRALEAALVAREAAIRAFAGL